MKVLFTKKYAQFLRTAMPYDDTGQLCPRCSTNLLVDFVYERGAKWVGAHQALGRCPSCHAPLLFSNVFQVSSAEVTSNVKIIGEQQYGQMLKKNIPEVMVVQDGNGAENESHIGDDSNLKSTRDYI